MKQISAIFITGANGLLGASIATRLCDQVDKTTRIIAIVRSARARAELKQLLGDVAWRTEILIGDICDQASLLALFPSKHFDHSLLIHCAADVAWDKNERELTPINVEGSRNAAKFIEAVSKQRAFIYVSSAYTRAENWSYRNGYEASKAAAERLLRSEFSDLPLSVFSCSLVIGSSSTGAISRFHGLYPLIRLASTPSTPFVIGRKDCLVDLVPIDWVTEQLLHTTRRAIEGETLDVVASCGNGAVRLDKMFRLIEAEINRFRLDNGFEVQPELPILTYRRWDFLKRSIEAWKPEELSGRELRHIMHLIEIYRPYTMSDEVRPPLNVSEQSPRGEELLGSSTRYWLEKHADQVLRRWRRDTKTSIRSIPQVHGPM